MLDAVNAPKNRAVNDRAVNDRAVNDRAVAAKPSAAAPHAKTRPQSSTRRLVRWHLSALGLLAVFSVAGQVAVQSALHAPLAAEAQAARQEALGQHLGLSALALQSAGTPAQRAGWETDLRDTAELWKRSEAALPQTGSAAAPLADAAAHQTAMLDSVSALLASLPPDSSRQKPDAARYLTPLLQQQKPYDTSLDAASAAYRQAAAADLVRLRVIQAGLCLLMLLALTALGLAASKLKRGGVAETIAQLEAMEEKRGEVDAALSVADRQIAQMRQTLENLSTVDALTGLSNHRAFQEQLDRELGRALRHNQPLSLLLLDVDQFKSYNDSYGHTEGDRALTLVSGLLQDTARASDIAARYGGKEFAIILTETDMMGAVVLGERLRQAVASADGLQRPLTASIGITTLTPMVFSAREFVAQAERALSHAKGDGRNRVAHAHRIAEALEDAAPVYAQAA